MKGYPKYHMIVDGKDEWLPLGAAGAAYDNGFVKVEIGQWVIDTPEEDPRQMTPVDRGAISEAADNYSASK